MTYTFTVNATNAIGDGPSSAPVSATPSTVPGAPTGVTATSYANTKSVVSWTAPASNGGAAITGYTVTATDTTTPANGGQTASSSASPVTVTGLTNGDAYTFTVTATNGSGVGPASAPSAPATPATIPGAPTNVAGSSYANTQSVVSWTPPASNGGAAITNYTVTSSPGGFTCSTVGHLLHRDRPDQRIQLHLHRRGHQRAPAPVRLRPPRSRRPRPPCPVSPPVPWPRPPTSATNASVSWTAPTTTAGPRSPATR